VVAVFVVVAHWGRQRKCACDSGATYVEFCSDADGGDPPAAGAIVLLEAYCDRGRKCACDSGATYVAFCSDADGSYLCVTLTKENCGCLGIFSHCRSLRHTPLIDL
jgi:hypothetical protein